jgi:hypothetical protein
MDKERKDKMSQQEYKKLVTPDFDGRWEQRGPGVDLMEMVTKTGDFKMFIQERKPASGGTKEGEEAVKGIISDNLGFATFVGILKKNSIAFVKKYSEAAQANGGAEVSIFYAGRLDEQKQVYSGNFGFSPKEKSGTFTMRSSGVDNSVNPSNPLSKMESPVSSARKEPNKFLAFFHKTAKS